MYHVQQRIIVIGRRPGTGYPPSSYPPPASATTPNAYVGPPAYPAFVACPQASFASLKPCSAPEASIICCERSVDEQTVIVGNSGCKVELPLYHVLTQDRENREVFSLPIPGASHLSEPSDILHSFTKTRVGQDMLTVWDTGALISLIPMSTVRALGLSLVGGSDVAFVVANGNL